MKIKLLKKETDEFKKFWKREWAKADKEHYGPCIRFTKKNYLLIAADDAGKIVGLLKFFISAGVAHISQILVAQGKRRQGIGKELVLKMEKMSKKANAHKIFFQTGEKWKAVPFYKSLGYKITGKHPNHSFHQNFVIFAKFLKN